MDTKQDYKLDNTNIYATLEAVAPNRTRCTFRHNGQEVTSTAHTRLTVFEFETFIQTVFYAHYADAALAASITEFPDWNKVTDSSEDDWSPID